MTRRSRLALALLLGACAPIAAAQSTSSSSCHADTDCVTHVGCCPACCACPSVVTRAQAEMMDRACAVATCDAPDCRARACRACAPVHPACVNGACVAR